MRCSAEASSTARSRRSPVRALIRLVAITLAGAVLYYAGLVNAMVISHPSPYGALLVVGGLAVSLAMLVVALLGDGRGDARTPPDRRYATASRSAMRSRRAS